MSINPNWDDNIYACYAIRIKYTDGDGDLQHSFSMCSRNPRKTRKPCLIIKDRMELYVLYQGWRWNRADCTPTAVELVDGQHNPHVVRSYDIQELENSLLCKCRNCGESYLVYKQPFNLTIWGYCSEKCVDVKARQFGSRENLIISGQHGLIYEIDT